MPQGRTPNTVLAGAFLLLGVALAVVISFVLSGAGDALTPTRTYTVVFTLADGATGIKPGSSVLLGGQPIGKVKSVDVVADPEPGREPGVDVVIAAHSRFKFLSNAVFFLERPLLGSFSTINITSLGDPSKPGAMALPDGGRIRGQLAPPAFLSQAGFGPDQAAEVRSIIADTRSFISRFSAMTERTTPKLESAVTDASDLVAEVRRKIPDWTTRLDRIAQNVESASNRLDPMLANAAGGVDQAREAIAKADTILAESRPKVDHILASVDSAAQKIDTQSVEQVNTAIADARRALNTVDSALTTATGLLREQTPNIRRVLANARLASDQLKLAIIEIRAQPWRALYTPSEKESETSVLYESTRTYAQAVSDLRAASEALEASLGAQPGPSGSGSPGAAQLNDRESLQQLAAQLKQAFDKYNDAERRLLDRLIGRAGGSADMHRTGSELNAAVDAAAEVTPESTPK